MSTRFGKPNRIVVVDKYSTSENYLDRGTRWFTTLTF